MKHNITTRQATKEELTQLAHYISIDAEAPVETCLEALEASFVTLIPDIKDEKKVHLMVIWSPEFERVPNHIEHFQLKNGKVMRIAMGFSYRFYKR
jgi:5-formyltetrahydrofolate cyclo-ligase